MKKGFEWFDMDAQYFMLEDAERTPMKVKWIRDGVVRLESENESHVYCGLLDGIHLTITKINEI